MKCTPQPLDSVSLGLDRIGKYAKKQGDFLPPQAVANGKLKTPTFDLYSTGDSVYCGHTMVSVTLDDGSSTTGQANPLMHHLFDSVLAQHNPGGNSTFREVCVNQNGANCDGHALTKVDADSVGGDLNNGGADYNQYIIDWLNPILSDSVDSCVISTATPTDVPQTVAPNELQVTAYPNPAASTVTIRVAGGSGTRYHLRVVDMYGKTLQQTSFTGTTFQLKPRLLSEGSVLFYQLTEVHTGRSTRGKLMIQ